MFEVKLLTQEFKAASWSHQWMRLQNFLKDIWGKKVNFNEKQIWLRTLESEYCKNIKPISYQITTIILDAVI